ncbi:hypothetical protein Ancab_004737 [Ancistrocladus abbreviatus]
MLINRNGGSAAIIGLITRILGCCTQVIAVATECHKFIDVCQQMFRAKGCRQPVNTFIGSAVEQAKKEIWQRVSDIEGPGTICVHGIACVGKTGIAAAINNQALRETSFFDIAIWVDVSNGVDLQRVQEDIARSMSINLPPDSNINTRAGILCATLTGEKKVPVDFGFDVARLLSLRHWNSGAYQGTQVDGDFKKIFCVRTV